MMNYPTDNLGKNRPTDTVMPLIDKMQKPNYVVLGHANVSLRSTQQPY